MTSYLDQLREQIRLKQIAHHAYCCLQEVVAELLEGCKILSL